MATSRFAATSVDTNADRVKTFLAARPGQFYCNECLSIEAVPGLNRTQVSRLIHPLREVRPYRRGRVVCVSCDQVSECIAYGLSVLARHGHTQVDRLALSQAHRLGATAWRRGRPIYENPCRGSRADAWREGWRGAFLVADRPRSRFQASFAAELYDYLVRHDRDDGLTVREITEGVERGSPKVNNGLCHLHRKGLVQRLLPTVVGQRRTPQRYRALPIPRGPK